VGKPIKSKKYCDNYNNLVLIRYRIQYDDSRKWVMVCPNCWELLVRDNKFYRYGGTWKAK